MRSKQREISSQEKDLQRAQIEREVERFLESGGKIHVLDKRELSDKPLGTYWQSAEDPANLVG